MARLVPFRTRLASAFENGYGDEGFFAKLVRLVVLMLIILVSILLAVPFAIGCVVARILRLVGLKRSSNDSK